MKSWVLVFRVACWILDNPRYCGVGVMGGPNEQIFV